MPRTAVPPHRRPRGWARLGQIDALDAGLADIFQTAVLVARAIRHVSACPGLNRVQSNGRAAGQDVLHLHLHLLPRADGHQVVQRRPDARTDRETLDRHAPALRRHLPRA